MKNRNDRLRQLEAAPSPPNATFPPANVIDFAANPAYLGLRPRNRSSVPRSRDAAGRRMMAGQSAASAAFQKDWDSAAVASAERRG